MAKLILLNKPFDVMCQFSGDGTRATLADLVPVKDVYPAGRLDRDSEGLVLLTDSGALQARISDPKHRLTKTYLVQVEGLPDEDALQSLRRGVMLSDGMTLPAGARRVDAPEWIWPRHPPIRERKSVPDCWIELTLREGRNRQVRRMTAAAGFPTLRLIRTRIGDWTLDGLTCGAWRALEIEAPAARPGPDTRRTAPQPRRNAGARTAPGRPPRG